MTSVGEEAGDRAQVTAVTLVPAALLSPQALSVGLQPMLLSVWVLLLLTSLGPLFLHCWRRLQPKEASS